MKQLQLRYKCCVFLIGWHACIMKKKDTLREKLELFIRKYYQNRLIKGLIYGVGLSLSYFLLLSMAEYFGRFPSQVRLGLFVMLMLGLGAILLYYIVYPLIQLLGFGKRLSYARAAQIIGRHFPEIDDKISNTLTLEHASLGEQSLIRAAVDQRIAALSPVPFQNAVDFKKNRKYWPVLVIPVAVVLVVALSGWWDDLSASSRRIAAYDREFLPEAPFTFKLLNNGLILEEGEDLLLQLDIQGQSIPAEAAIVLPAGSNRMNREDNGSYSYRIENVEQGFSFHFSAAGFRSKSYEVAVVPVPKLRSFNLQVNPPAYTRIKPYIVEGRLSHEVPEGSRLEWQLQAYQADYAIFKADTVEEEFLKKSSSEFSYKRTVKKDLLYSVFTANAEVRRSSIKENKIRVTKDAYPDIDVSYQMDSTNKGVLYYGGTISDDYGFSSLLQVVELGDQKIKRPLRLNKGVLKQSFSSALLLDTLAEEQSQEVKVYFELRDNDAVNGAKLRRSEVFDYRLLGIDEREQKLEEDYQQYFDTSEENRKRQEEIERALKALQRQMMQKKKMGWEEKSKVKDLLEKQQQLLKKQEENRERLEKLKEEEKKLGKKPEELEEREKQIEELEEDNRELEELMKEIEELLEELDMEKLREKLNQMEQAGEQNRQQEQRKEDLLKDLKFQKDVLEQAKKLDELSEKMEELGKDDDANSSSGQEQEKQNDIREEFEKAAEKIEELREQNAEFDNAAEKQKMEQTEQEASDEMNKADQSLQKDQQQKASESQKKAAEKMQEMSKGLQQSLMQMQAQQNQENIETLRQILENLEILSFGIEELSLRSRQTQKADPSFKQLLVEQKRLQDGALIIEDSLLALGNRVPQLKDIVYEEVGEMKRNLARGIEELEEVQMGKASASQQQVMNSANKLALLLDESMQQMLQQQASMMPGSQSCQKPGNKPSSSGMKKMLQELAQQMGDMKSGSKEGEGKKEGKGKGERGEEIVKMLSRQEQIRNALEEMKSEAGSQGSKGNLQKAIDEMKKLEEDVLDGELENNYRERLAEIETRLLESEKAELEQKQDEKRESKTADELKQLYQEELDKYLRQKETEREEINRSPIDFKNYYKKRATEYLK